MIFVIVRVLGGEEAALDAAVQEDIKVPEQVDTVLGQLFDFLQDRVGLK